MESRNGSFESIFYPGGNMKRLLQRFLAWIRGSAAGRESPVSVVVPADEIARANRQAAPCIMFDLTPVED